MAIDSEKVAASPATKMTRTDWVAAATPRTRPRTLTRPSWPPRIMSRSRRPMLPGVPCSCSSPLSNGGPFGSASCAMAPIFSPVEVGRLAGQRDTGAGGHIVHGHDHKHRSVAEAFERHPHPGRPEGAHAERHGEVQAEQGIPL